MSKKRNRTKLSKAASSKEYNAITTCVEYPMYYDEFWSYYRTLNTHSAKPKNKVILNYQVRMYRTWKYNRMKQYK